MTVAKDYIEKLSGYFSSAADPFHDRARQHAADLLRIMDASPSREEVRSLLAALAADAHHGSAWEELEIIAQQWARQQGFLRP
jgi:hypothetical protein